MFAFLSRKLNGDYTRIVATTALFMTVAGILVGVFGFLHLREHQRAIELNQATILYNTRRVDRLMQAAGLQEEGDAPAELVR